MSITHFIALFLFITLQAIASPQVKDVTGQDLLTQKIITIKSENKKGLIVVFLSAKCPCSNSHTEELRKLAEDFLAFNFVAIHSNVDEDKTLSQAYFRNLELPFPVIEDQKNRLADQFKANKTPHSYVITPDGSIVYQGGVSNSSNFQNADRRFLREALDDLSNNQKIRTPEGRTLGCAITRGEPHVW